MESLASLGVPWPPPQGWRKRLENSANETEERQQMNDMNREITIEFDGGCRPSNPGNKYGSFSVIRDGFEVLRREEVEFGKGTNNEAEFNALELALSEAVSDIHGADALCSGFRLKILTDSMIVKNRLVGKNRATVFRKHKESSSRMIAHANRCLELMERFESFSVEWQPREKNVANFGH